jgi:hypothetical protein
MKFYLAIAGELPCTVVCRDSRKTTRWYPRRFADESAASSVEGRTWPSSPPGGGPGPREGGR